MGGFPLASLENPPKKGSPPTKMIVCNNPFRVSSHLSVKGLDLVDTGGGFMSTNHF